MLNTMNGAVQENNLPFFISEDLSFSQKMTLIEKIKALPSEDRNLLVLYYFEHLDLATIAVLFQEKTEVIKLRLNTILKKLKD